MRLILWAYQSAYRIDHKQGTSEGCVLGPLGKFYDWSILPEYEVCRWSESTDNSKERDMGKLVCVKLHIVYIGTHNVLFLP